MRSSSASGPAGSRVNRCLLKLGTALGSGVLAAALLVPVAAQAADASVRYQLATPVMQGSNLLPAGVTSAAAGVTPQDLTMRPLQRLTMTSGGGTATYSYSSDITTTANNTPGVNANANYAGNVVITAGNITTSGNYSNGISATAGGNIAITAGNITTTGNYSAGVQAYSSGGNLTIKVGDVSTNGITSYATIPSATSNGINATTAGGNINITAGSVSANGVGQTGIYANANGGNVAIKAGDVTANGSISSIGVAGYGHDVTITTGNVAAGAAGVVAEGIGPGAAVNVTVNGDISTYGRNLSHGVFATSDGTLSVTTTGEITTKSLFGLVPSVGILAEGYSDVTVNSEGRIKTYGRALGILGESTTGSVTIDASAINTYGRYSTGIEAVASNDTATVVAGDITVSGVLSRGILAQGATVDVTLNGALQMAPASLAGISAQSTGDLTIINNGSITLGDASGYAIKATAAGNIVIGGQGTITTGNAQGGTGIYAVSTGGGSISITQGAIVSNNYGVEAFSKVPSPGTGTPANGINIDVASVTTTGTGQAGTGIVAVDYNVGSTVTINAGTVTTIGDYASAITANAIGGSVTVTGGAISTRGKAAAGIVLVGNDYETVTVNSITTTGLGGVGASVITNQFAPNGGAINVNIGSISTAGDAAPGLFAYSFGANTIQVGSITTAGKYSDGIDAVAGASGGLTINAGPISTAGDESIAILAQSFGGLSLTETGTITTQGNNASGVIAVAGAGPVNLTLTGAISTQGGGSFGVYGKAYNGAVSVQAGDITTTGGGAPALDVMALTGSTTVDLSSASTTGDKSPAVLVKGATGVTFTANQITTSGAGSNALVIRSGYYGVVGDATVNVGSITTTGVHSAGIDAFTVGQNNGQASALSINVGSITTTGIDSPGISAFNTYGAININASNISTQGAEANGMLLFGGADINLQVGSISTGAADAIEAYGSGSGTITVGVSGKVASTGANGIVAVSSYGATNITVASTGSVSGAADAIQVQTGTGQVMVNNAGVITGGTGYAVNVTGLPSSTATAGVQINNTGTIFGAVNLAAAGGNVLNNAGTFVATKDSDFGGGPSQFVNTGVLKIAPAAAGTVNFLNLATFQNAGGLIDLRTAPVGTVFSLSGDYVASGDARLGLGVNGNTADKLVILGAATGATSILLAGNPAAATLLAKPLTLVEAGAGSTGTFTLSNANLGLIHYGLQAASGAAQGPVSQGPVAAAGAPVSYDLTASAGAPVYGMLKLQESAQTIWRQSADAWSEHLAAMRGDAWDGGAAEGANSGYGLGSGRYWVQAYGSTGDRNATVGTGYGGVSVDYSQADAGVQVGADLARTATRLGAVGWGVTAGYTSSQIDALGGTLKSDVDTFNLGGYAVLNHGRYFANGLVKFDHHQISTTDSVAGYSANLNGNSYGAQFEVGRHFGSDRFAFEPTVSLTYVRTSLDAVSIDSQTLAFGDEDGVSGKIGGRFYANRTIHGTPFVFYAGAAAVDDFTGSQKATFYSGGTSQNVSAGGEGAYAQALAGVSARTMRDITLYLEGDANFGGSHSGAGVRLGARF